MVTTSTGAMTASTTTASIRKGVATGREKEWWNDSDWKEKEVDEEFYSQSVFDERDAVHEGVPESAEDEVEEIVRVEDEVVIDNAAMIPERSPWWP